MWAFAGGSPRSYVSICWNRLVAGTGAALASRMASHVFLGKWAVLLQSGNHVLGSSASPGGRAGSWHVASVSVIDEDRYAVLENCL